MTGSGPLSLWLLPGPVVWGARIAAWVVLAGVLVLSLLPSSLMPAIGQGLVEHLVAYAIFATAGALGYGRRLRYFPLFVIAVASAGLFEFAQLLLPERTFSTFDFMAGVVGAALGVSLAHLIRRSIGQPRVLRRNR